MKPSAEEVAFRPRLDGTHSSGPRMRGCAIRLRLLYRKRARKCGFRISTAFHGPVLPKTRG